MYDSWKCGCCDSKLWRKKKAVNVTVTMNNATHIYWRTKQTLEGQQRTFYRRAAWRIVTIVDPRVVTLCGRVSSPPTRSPSLSAFFFFFFEVARRVAMPEKDEDLFEDVTFVRFVYFLDDNGYFKVNHSIRLPKKKSLTLGGQWCAVWGGNPSSSVSG